MHPKTVLACVVALSFIAATASAQEGEEPAASAPPAEAAGADAGRFRFGIDGTAGLESVSVDGSDTGLSGAMFGLNLRLGWQFSHLLAVYAQPHLSFGSLSTEVGGGSFSGGTGTIVVTAMAEATFIDQLFAGAGFGYGILNNPSGPTIQLRAGGYPLMGRGDDGIRRKGLMVGLDFRMVFVDGATGTLIMGAIGYEAF